MNLPLVMGIGFVLGVVAALIAVWIGGKLYAAGSVMSPPAMIDNPTEPIPDDYQGPDFGNAEDELHRAEV